MTKRDNLTIKDAYEEAGRNYRYYLGWRERLLAGYLALLAGLSVSLPWFLESAGRFGRAFVLVPFGTAGLVTLLICVLERRNRELYRTSQNVAARCEKSLPDGTGLFSKLE